MTAEAILGIMGCMLLLVCIITWLKALADDEERPDTRYCQGCQEGFCMAEPKSVDCIKWQKECRKGEEHDSGRT